jgi:excisionase family DNA binding protein
MEASCEGGKVKQLIDVREAADRLGLKVSTIRAWLLARKLPFVRCGRSIRIPVQVIDEFIERNTVPAERRDVR